MRRNTPVLIGAQIMHEVQLTIVAPTKKFHLVVVTIDLRETTIVHVQYSRRPALWADTLVSGQLYLRSPWQNPIWMNSNSYKLCILILHSRKRLAPVADTFSASWGCPLTVASAVCWLKNPQFSEHCFTKQRRQTVCHLSRMCATTPLCWPQVLFYYSNWCLHCFAFHYNYFRHVTRRRRGATSQFTGGFQHKGSP